MQAGWRAWLFVYIISAVVVAASGSTVYLYDLTHTLTAAPAAAFEEVHAVAAVQGIVNREAPQLYVNYTDVDETWWRYTLSVSNRTGFLSNPTVVQLHNVTEVVETFRSHLAGAVVYDPAVPATSNLASTFAGIRDAVPVCHRNATGSLYDVLVASGRLPVVESYVGRFTGNVTGSAKNDAYRWAIDEYVEDIDPQYLAYYVDYFWATSPGAAAKADFTCNTVSNHDFWIAHKAFFFDLSFWADEAPNDDPGQPLGTDYNTVLYMLSRISSKASGMTWMGGFTPWLFKYVDSKHGGVPTEWQTMAVLGQFNVFADADACCFNGAANMAFHQHFPLKQRYAPHPAPTAQQLYQAGYLSSLDPPTVTPATYAMWYVGDYDSAAWLNRRMPATFNDSARGSVELNWAYDPELSRRFPPAFDYFFNHATPSDTLITGDSGAGYLNPTSLFKRPLSSLPPAGELWVSHNTPLYQQFGITFTGFIINGAAGPLTTEAQALYESFSPNGMVDQQGYAPSSTVPYLQGNTPVFAEDDINEGNPSDAAADILKRIKPGTQFAVYRSVLKPASWHASVVKAVAAQNPAVHFVSASTLAYLARVALGGSNDDRVTYLRDNLRPSVRAGQTLTLQVVVRNEGWNTLDGSVTLVCSVVAAGGAAASGTGVAAAPLAPGQEGVFSGTVTVPASATGQALVTYQLQRNGTTFDAHGNLPWQATVSVSE